MNPLLEENILKLSQAINGLVDQMKQADRVNVNSREAGEILGYSKHSCDIKMREHRKAGDIVMWRDMGRYFLYDKNEVLELRARLFTQHELKIAQ